MNKPPVLEALTAPPVDPLDRFKDPEDVRHPLGGARPPIKLSVDWHALPPEDIPLHVQFPGLNGGD